MPLSPYGRGIKRKELIKKINKISERKENEKNKKQHKTNISILSTNIRILYVYRTSQYI
jgi:hypothetical protein